MSRKIKIKQDYGAESRVNELIDSLAINYTGAIIYEKQKVHGAKQGRGNASGFGKTIKVTARG